MTDPACARSWGTEPTLRRLRWDVGDALVVVPVMAGMERRYPPDAAATQVAAWLDVAASTGMPVDPRGWWEAPLASSHPACLAVKAGQEQGPEAGARLLRGLREGIACLRRKLDTTEALVEEARAAGLDAARFRVDLASSAAVEAFGADLEAVRAWGAESPALVLGDGAVVSLLAPYEEVRGAVEGAARRAGAPERPEVLGQAGATGERPEVLGPPGTGSDGPGVGARRPAPAARPSPLEALARFGRLATPELEAVCARPGPPLLAELWALAAEWRVRPVRVLTGELWEVA